MVDKYGKPVTLEKAIHEDLKNIMNTYDYSLEELDYDKQKNALKILGLPVTKTWLRNIIIPVITTGAATLFDYIGKQFSSKEGTVK